jgi:DNA-binding NtrC family response regulator
MSQKKPRILLLEDEEQWIDMLSGYLEDDYEVCPAKSLGEAEAWLERATFRLAIVDIRLIAHDGRDESGFRFIEELRTREILRDMSLVIVSAYGTVERVRKAFKDYKVYDFVDKGTLDPLKFKQTVTEAMAEAYLGTRTL